MSAVSPSPLPKPLSHQGFATGQWFDLQNIAKTLTLKL